MILTEKQKFNFLKKFIQGSPNECWEWSAGKFKQGYGAFGIDKKMVNTHRVAYELFVGPIPEGLCVLHTCDNPSCVNPNHLFLGTQKDNIQDMVKKGRCYKGENHHWFGKDHSGEKNWNFGKDHSGEKNGMFGKHHKGINLGEKNGNAKLTWEKVNEIRSSSLSLRELAKQFNVTLGHISNVKSFRIWKT